MATRPSSSSKSHGIYMLIIDPDTVTATRAPPSLADTDTIWFYYVGKTRRTFDKRWSKHKKEVGVNHKVRALKECDTWTPTTHILLDFNSVPPGFQTASLLNGLEVIMNAVMGATMEQDGLWGLNVNTIDCVPVEVSSYPEAVIIDLYNHVLAFLETGRDLPTSTQHERWTEILGDAGLYMEEAYELSFQYIIAISRGHAMQSTFERNGMPQKLAKYAQQIKSKPAFYTKKRNKDKHDHDKENDEPEPTPTVGTQRTAEGHRLQGRILAAGLSPKTKRVRTE